MSSRTQDAPIRIRGLAKTYRLGFFLNRQVRALQGLDLEVEEGQVYAILGPNGAGKSTTLKILMDLVRATEGTATLFGHPVTQRDARARVGFLPENPAPYDYLTGLEFVRLAGRLTGLGGASLTRRVNEVLELVGMERAGALQIRRYSKGMVQRIGLAQALVNKPDLLILDEPTSGLDPVGRRQMRDLILAERARGATILFCTHIIPDVEALCDRVAVLVGGRRVQEGSVKELLRSGVPLMEVVLEGVAADEVRGWGLGVSQVFDLGGRLTVTVTDEHSQHLLSKALASGARVVSLQPVRFSLEDLFLDAMKKAEGPKVGGEISL